MKRFFIILLVMGVCISESWAQDEITEANYLRQDSILWDTYYQREAEFGRLWKELPEEKHDSLRSAFQDVYDKTVRENTRLACRFASVPSGLQRLYMVRFDVNKDTLQQILNTLPPDMRDSFYGKNIQTHVSNHQIVEGDTLPLFPCMQSDGTPLDRSLLDDKRLLFIYEGLGCMGASGRAYLDSLCSATSRDDFFIVVYCLDESLKELKRTQERYGGKYIHVSDFMGDATPVKIVYGCQAMPTCFLTDKSHRVLVKCEGLWPVEEYIEKTGFFR